ncbi:MAG: HAD family phosphatase [Candidatus Aminicenantes bacterium]|nr:HAD family phosphatase [Candidatus Aminicenantes bacterium]
MKAVIFDMDGLMIDSERLYFEAQREIGRRFNRQVKDEVLWKLMGRKPLESLKIFVNELDLPLSPEQAKDIRDEIMRIKMSQDLKPMPGLYHILNSLQGKLRLAVSTGAEQEFLDIALDNLGLRDKFDVLQASNEINKGKPDPEIFLVTCSKLGVAPEESIILEDSENGIKAGKAAGSYAIAIPNDYTRSHDFSEADFIAVDLFMAEHHIQEKFGLNHS